MHITAQIAGMIKELQEIDNSCKKSQRKFAQKIDEMIERLNCEIDEIEIVHLSFLHKQESEIMTIIYDITKSIADLKELLNSNDLFDISSYKSKNNVFKIQKLPPKFNKEWFY